MNDAQFDLTACDREPIHIPGSIQPHGAMLVADPASLLITHGAGDIEGLLGVEAWLGQGLAALIGAELAAKASGLLEAPLGGGYVGKLATALGVVFDVNVHTAPDAVIVELEPQSQAPPSSANLLVGLDRAAGTFERATTLAALCERGAVEFRALTGFDRVMIYRFLDDGAGAVLAEDRRPDLHSFLNHRFPGSDIPRQARALYVRNLVRVTPDVSYVPAPLRPAWTGDQPLDMSDCVLRSVSPIHLQYLKNMGVAASASVSIVKDGVLWGLIACHHETPRTLPFDIRVACRALAGGFARQIKAKEEAEGYRERLRLRGFEDDIVALLSREGGLEDALSDHLDEVRLALLGDGVAVLRGGALVKSGSCPSDPEIRDLADWLVGKSAEAVFATERLSEVYPRGEAFAAVASGALGVTLSSEDRWLLIWFRAEEVEVVNWAGNPHKDTQTGPDEVLTPRASFEAWREAVHGRSRRWTLPEIEAAGRMRAAIFEVRQSRRLRDLNRALTETVAEKDLLIQQKQFLLGEVNHRVQNSLQLVSSFLALQARASSDTDFQAAIEEARSRITAVSLVHRRLYRADQIEIVDAARYIEELCGDMVGAMGEDWSQQFTLDLAPIMIPTERAVILGLVLTELVINANKYAYDGAPGPIEILLVEDRARLRLAVADRGKGMAVARKGFGSRMMAAMVSQLAGDLDYEDNKPGLRAVLSAPIVG
jgi:chemotaxis family two-component system sensor kinase Cph1